MSLKTYTEEQVIIHGRYPIKGTLSVPKTEESKYPAVLIIVGSGEVDRNGRAEKAKLTFNVYNEIADIISSMGAITLRFDKRGVGESGGNFYETGLWDNLEDIECLVAFLRKYPSVDPERIILLGHSEGSMLATAVNARNPVGGMVLIAGAAETLSEATSRQRDAATKELLNSPGLKGLLFRLLKLDRLIAKQNDKFMQKLMNSKNDIMKANFAKINAKWLREHYSYNVIEDLKKATCPVLAITGDKDAQVNPERVKDVPSLVKGEAEYHILENMDHSLKEYSGPVSILNAIKQYKKSQDQPIHPQLKKIISDWLMSKYLA